SESNGACPWHLTSWRLSTGAAAIVMGPRAPQSARGPVAGGNARLDPERASPGRRRRLGLLGERVGRRQSPMVGMAAGGRQQDAIWNAGIALRLPVDRRAAFVPARRLPSSGARN